MRVVTKPPAKVTRAGIETTWRRQSADRGLIVRDKPCRGLALALRATAMTWGFSWRPRGLAAQTDTRWPNRTATLGNPESHAADDARTEANRIKRQVAAGLASVWHGDAAPDLAVATVRATIALGQLALGRAGTAEAAERAAGRIWADRR